MFKTNGDSSNGNRKRQHSPVYVPMRNKRQLDDAARKDKKLKTDRHNGNHNEEEEEEDEEHSVAIKEKPTSKADSKRYESVLLFNNKNVIYVMSFESLQMEKDFVTMTVACGFRIFYKSKRNVSKITSGIVSYLKNNVLGVRQLRKDVPCFQLLTRCEIEHNISTRIWMTDREYCIDARVVEKHFQLTKVLSPIDFIITKDEIIKYANELECFNNASIFDQESQQPSTYDTAGFVQCCCSATSSNKTSYCFIKEDVLRINLQLETLIKRLDGNQSKIMELLKRIASTTSEINGNEQKHQDKGTDQQQQQISNDKTSDYDDYLCIAENI